MSSSQRARHAPQVVRSALRTALVLACVGAGSMVAQAGGERCAAAARKAQPVTIATTVLYGPPMVCHEVVIGKAKSLPWDGGRGGSDSSYDVRKLPADAAALLAAEPSTIVRMETLRRAAVYLSYDKVEPAGSLAWELIGRRANAVLQGESTGKIDPQAWFDVAYFIGCLNQVGASQSVQLGSADGIPGYMFMKKAIKAAQEAGLNGAALAEMHFGAAVMTHPAMRNMEYQYAVGTRKDVYDQHVLAALEFAKDDPLLETNLAAHLKNFGNSIEDVRKVAAAK